ncbi:MAG: protein-glutamine gamma-glutamyltransferase [Clostridia bacterium]|nr:protein-glutamine gamma-glutamyltransferase [Clostridia bacterium]
MINILSDSIDIQTLMASYPYQSIERKTLELMASSSRVYTYSSPDELKFELDLRKKIIHAALALYHSSFSFEVFRESKCNSDYWERTPEGGFLLKRGNPPSSAIKDIYTNSSKYGTECSTAIVIIYYKALLDILPEELFNRLFSEIYLMNWQHLDPDLGLRVYYNEADYFPGDCRYFKNPDVDPLTPEWQGENTIYLENGLYYGHGVGINTADKMIDKLNGYRIEGSNTPAYLMDLAKRPDFKSLARQYLYFSASQI